MSMMIDRIARFAALLFLAICLTRPAHAQEVVGMNLTWQQDPTTTMTIDWHTDGPVDSPTIRYRVVGDDEWVSGGAEPRPFPFSERIINRVELTGLAPATTYEFGVEQGGGTFQFRTMPADALQPIRFATGGDVRHTREMMEKTAREAAKYDPDFLLFGGDLAYGNGDPRRIENWYDWFESIMTTFITEEGRIIPVVVAIGNHEVFENRRLESAGETPEWAYEKWGLRGGDATFFFDLFPMPQRPGYGVLDFGDYMSVVLLDTDHQTPVHGEQTEWLRGVLEARTHVPHVFPVYHVPAYPSVRSFDGSVSADVRENWVPLFDEFGIRAAFENHDHAYKRTYPLRGGEIDPQGTVYIGDGAWGVGVREIGRSQDQDGPAWYLANAQSERHFILVTLQGTHQHFLTVNEDGRVIDQYPNVPLPAPLGVALGTP
jgi:acid phosphatase type 7